MKTWIRWRRRLSGTVTRVTLDSKFGTRHANFPAEKHGIWKETYPILGSPWFWSPLNASTPLVKMWLQEKKKRKNQMLFRISSTISWKVPLISSHLISISLWIRNHLLLEHKTNDGHSVPICANEFLNNYYPCKSMNGVRYPISPIAMVLFWQSSIHESVWFGVPRYEQASINVYCYWQVPWSCHFLFTCHWFASANRLA